MNNQIENEDVNIRVPTKEIGMICEQFGIRKENIQSRKEDFSQIIKEYFKANSQYNNNIKVILAGVTDFLK